MVNLIKESKYRVFWLSEEGRMSFKTSETVKLYVKRHHYIISWLLGKWISDVRFGGSQSFSSTKYDSSPEIVVCI